MQRLFSAFPTGLPGLALVLLRVSIALQLLFHAPQHGGSSWWIAAVAGLGLLAVVGLFTPVVAAACAALLLAWMVMPEWRSTTAAAFAAVDALALALLGPGGYSVDARLFGRRLLTVPAPPTHTLP